MNEFIIYSVHPSKDEIYGDAWEYHLELNGKIIVKYGDYYHDKGSEKCLGFIDGYAYLANWKEKIDYTIKRNTKVDVNLE